MKTQKVDWSLLFSASDVKTMALDFVAGTGLRKAFPLEVLDESEKEQVYRLERLGANKARVLTRKALARRK